VLVLGDWLGLFTTVVAISGMANDMAGDMDSAVAAGGSTSTGRSFQVSSG
jgi:hypothetical protein